jgi:UDP-N-acetylmuramate-alanine ligase
MTTSLFFSGIGGRGMQALARLMLSCGHVVTGPDRAYDQSASPEIIAARAYA